jgi:IS5 family transposase
VYLNAVPDDATLIRWANLIQPKTLEKFNERITQLAIERKVTCGRKMRTDGTVVDSNIRPPSDGRLLSDSVRVLARTVARAQTILKAARKKILDELEDFTQTAKGLSRKIGETLRSKKKEAQIAGRQQYEKLLDMTGQTIDWAVETQKQLQKQSQRRANLNESTPFMVSHERAFGRFNHAFGASRITSSAYQKRSTKSYPFNCTRS